MADQIASSQSVVDGFVASNNTAADSIQPDGLLAELYSDCSVHSKFVTACADTKTLANNAKLLTGHINTLLTTTAENFAVVDSAMSIETLQSF